MANRYETGQSIGIRKIGKSIPVRDMPDFTEALVGYKVLLKELQVPPQDAERAVDITIENSTTRKDGNRFINLVNSVSREVRKGKPQPLVTLQRK